MSTTFFRSLLLPLAVLLFGANRASGEERSVVPMTLIRGEDGAGRVYLTVRFGAAMGPMRLDTGASTTRVRLAPWNEALPALGASASTGASGATSSCEDVEAKIVELKASEGNDIGRANYRVTRCATSDGDDLLGLDFFRGARFTLDFERGEMVFFPHGDAQGFRPFHPLGPDRRLVGIDLRIGKTAAVGLFDTGAEVSAVDRRFVERHKKLFVPLKKKTKASDASGRRFASDVYRVKEIDLGEGRISRDVAVVAYDFGPLRQALGAEAPLILGFDILSGLHWELDFASPDAPRWKASAR